MSEHFDYGPLRAYEVTWTNGHVETIKAHTVTMPTPKSLFGFVEVDTKTVEYITFHGEIDGRWRLLLAVRPEQIVSIRDKATEDEVTS